MGVTMLERSTFLVILSMVSMLVIQAPALAQSERPDWEPITQERLLNPEDGDWASYRRTYDVTGFSPLDEINTSNVADLRPVWSYSMRDNNRWVASPVVSNGLMYVAEGSGRIVAFDVVSGEVEWIHIRNYPEDIATSQAYNRHRGVSVYEGKVYWGTADSFLVALDAATGEQLWEVQTGDYKTGRGHNHPGLIVDGKIIMGATGGERTMRGEVSAYETESGDLLWRTYTVPEPGGPGSESWNRSELPPLGGATWGTISYDPELRLVYVGTGQPTPWPITLRGGGDALYTNSILALDIDSGDVEWYFQIVPADNWDMDTPYESMLVDLEIDGVMRQALIETSKIGWGIVLDRATGEFIQSFRTGYDNIITEWTDEGRPVFNPDVIPSLEDVDSGKVFQVCPHLHGTRNLNSPSYSPVTGLYYIGLNNTCMDATFVSDDPQPNYLGMNSTPTMVPGYEYVGEFAAFDPATGERAWEFRVPSGASMSASALATGGGIVFGGSSDRYFFALDAESGEELWQTRLNGDISGAPVTFEVDGTQYVAVAAGGRIAQTTSYAVLSGVDVPQGTGVVWVFALP
jgi:alcohol dehydrogenase (cytochrome c)